MGSSVGERIETVRRLRGLSIRQAAGLAGVAQSTWSRIEAGTRSANNRHLLAAMAQALQCSITELTGQPGAPTDRATARVSAAVHATLQALLDTEVDLPSSVRDVRPVAELSHELSVLRDLGLACAYAEAVTRVPRLLRETHAHFSGPDRQPALEVFSGVARWTMISLKNLGFASEAWVAAERSHAAAAVLADPVTLGVAAWARGHAATSCGAYTRAVALATSGIEGLRDVEGPVAAQVRGSLHLLAGWAERGLGHPDDGDRLFATAMQIARDVGEPGEDVHGLAFGPTNVGLWQVSVAVEAGEPGRAVELAGGLTPGTLPASRQSAFYLDLGRALADVGNADRAVRALLQAERIGPQRLQRSAIARETVRGLVQTARRDDPPALRGLAERLDVTR